MFPHQNKTVGFGQRPRHNRYTQTDTCVRWELAVTYHRYKFVTASLLNGYVTAVSILKPPYGGFRSENEAATWIWIQKLKNPLELLEAPIGTV